MESGGVMVRWTGADARAALTRLVARRRRHQTRFGIQLHVERLLARKTCPSCWRTTGFGMQATDLRQPLAHAIGCEAMAFRGFEIRYRADPTVRMLLRDAGS